MLADTGDDLELLKLRRDAEELPLNPTTNHLQSRMKDHYFEDGVRKVDFVLVRRGDRSPGEIDHESHQKVFENNLLQEGLEFELSSLADSPLVFVKIHAPRNVLRRYAEILKIRLPMKKLACFGDDKDLLNKLPVLRNITELVKVANRSMFAVNTDKFPPKNKHLTAVYSRDREYLFNMNEDIFKSSVRARIVLFILERQWFVEQVHSVTSNSGLFFGIEKLLADQTYLAAYPLHEGPLDRPDNLRSLLVKEWSSLRNFYQQQPLDYVEEYFGVKIAMYFAWLGFYTYSLVPPAIVGIICMLYGALTVYDNVPSNEICNDNSTVMCPSCDHFCGYWSLNSTCTHSRLIYLVDNPTTIFFATFMSFWAATFLEMWKRYSARIMHRWDLTTFDLKEQQPRAEYLAKLKHARQEVNVVTGQYEPHVSFLKNKLRRLVLSSSVVLLLLVVAVVIVVAVVLYRMSVLAALSYWRRHQDATTVTSVSAACINLVVVLLLNNVYGRVAVCLTDYELPRTRLEYDDSLTLKIYLLQFVNFYSSIFYIAFFKGRFTGYPANYHRVFSLRLEECGPGGCLFELTIQLSIFLVGKQALMAIWEMVLPKLFTFVRKLSGTILTNGTDTGCLPQWAADFALNDWGRQNLFAEYLEMVIQFGMVTIFVASFPLAPLFAIANNVLEMRLDGRKLLSFYRRPVAERVRHIGVWLKILSGVGRLAVLSNACIIAFTSNFIPRMVYQMSGAGSDSLHGFVQYSLSEYNTSLLQEEQQQQQQQQQLANMEVPATCRYWDYRHGPDSATPYELTSVYWHVLAARLVFVLVFQNVVLMVISAIMWLTPDIPRKLKNLIMQENHVTQEIILQIELCRAQGYDEAQINNLGEMLLRRIIGNEESI